MGLRAWRQWCHQAGRQLVIAQGTEFPVSQWLKSAGPEDIASCVISTLAQRVGRPTAEFAHEWQTKSTAERERFWTTLCPEPEDSELRAILNRVTSSSPAVREEEWESPETIPALVQIAPDWPWPAVLLRTDSAGEFQQGARVAATWAFRVPHVPIAVSVPLDVWQNYERTARESRDKALLREGRVEVSGADPVVVEQSLERAGAPRAAITTLTASPVDELLLESAVAAVRASVPPPTTVEEQDRARSLAERFLFDFLDTLPETAGRFELNATLEIRFGRRPMEVDLLCRRPRVAIELDGYFHFLAAENYRRDRTKDWELQKHGYIVLRFLSEDVVRHLDIIRDRILETLCSLSVESSNHARDGTPGSPHHDRS